MSTKPYAVFKRAQPYFDIVRTALGDLVDGHHFFDCVAEDIVYEVLYEVSGWPRVIEGREGLMDSFRGYCQAVELHSADHLLKYVVDNGQGIVIEYQVHGTILGNGVKYDNRFCSIIKIANRKVVYWRDYMDSLAAWNALTAPSK